MNCLLDTCTFVWLCAEPERLSPRAKAAINGGSGSLALSQISILEISLKWAAGKIILPQPPRVWIETQTNLWQLNVIPIADDDIYRMTELPRVHLDPFDRLLVATAINRRFSLLTPDEWLHQYPVHCVW